jgi:hypothetical protein
MLSWDCCRKNKEEDSYGCDFVGIGKILRRWECGKIHFRVVKVRRLKLPASP